MEGSGAGRLTGIKGAAHDSTAHVTFQGSDLFLCGDGRALECPRPDMAANRCQDIAPGELRADRGPLGHEAVRGHRFVVGERKFALRHFFDPSVLTNEHVLAVALQK